MFLSNDVNMVIYHGGCTDGFGSAYSAYKLLGDNAEYIGGYHYQNPSKILDEKKDIVLAFCDFSYSLDIISKLLEKDNILHIFIIDHHIYNIEHFSGFSHPKLTKIFDIKHSGAFLSWQFFHPNIEIPLFIKYIEDHDLWKHELDNTLDFSARFKWIDMTFTEFDKYLNEENVNNTIQEGKLIKKYDDSNIEFLTKNANIKVCQLSDNQIYFIVCLNSPILKSELGHILLEKFPLADFSYVYNYLDGKNITNASLRSRINDNNLSCDVNYVAKLYGGGGHSTASGVQIPGFQPFLGNLITDYYHLKKNKNFTKIKSKMLFMNYNLVKKFHNKLSDSIILQFNKNGFINYHIYPPQLSTKLDNNITLKHFFAEKFDVIHLTSNQKEDELF